MARRPRQESNRSQIRVSQTSPGVQEAELTLADSPSTVPSPACPSVQHVSLADRPLIFIGPDHRFWTLLDPAGAFEASLKQAIVWVKPPHRDLKVAEAVEWLKRRDAIVRLLAPDRVSEAPLEQSEPPVVLSVADVRSVLHELLVELCAREGVELKRTEELAEFALAGAGL